MNRLETESPINAALVELEALKQQAIIMGNDDYESGAIQGLIEGVQAGKIDPTTALNQARNIIATKQR